MSTEDLIKREISFFTTQFIELRAKLTDYRTFNCVITTALSKAQGHDTDETSSTAEGSAPITLSTFL